MTVPAQPKVFLPRTTAAETVALVVALKTALQAAQAAQVHASEERVANSRTRRREADAAPAAAVAPVPIAGNVASCMRRLEAACAALRDARRESARQREARATQSARRTLSRQCQRGWTALRAQVGVWRETGVLAQLPEATRQAMEQVFPADAAIPGHGRRVLAAWTEGAELLERVRAQGLDAAFAGLGAGEVLAHVTTQHQRLGAALGVTVASPAPEAGMESVGATLDAVRELVREYVTKVRAMDDPEVPGSAALADTLLGPLAAVSSRRRAPTAASTPVADAPAAPALKPTGTG